MGAPPAGSIGIYTSGTWVGNILRMTFGIEVYVLSVVVGLI
jgi:hypothetical protein